MSSKLDEAREKARANVKARTDARVAQIRGQELSTNNATTISTDSNNSSYNTLDNAATSSNKLSVDVNSTVEEEVGNTFSNNESNTETVINKNNVPPEPEPHEIYPEGLPLLNIAGEIINLQGNANNSGRINAAQFRTMFNANDEEIKILQKVFGIPTLRHTPQIMLEGGCSLTEAEARIVKKILEARKKNLERGASLLKGLTQVSTHQKIRNYELLLKKISEYTGAAIEECKPSTTFNQSLPSFSGFPKLPFFSKKDDTVERLLILILTLLVGVSSEKIRAKNIRDRLGQETIEGILRSINSRSVKAQNISKILDTVLQPSEATAATEAIPSTAAAKLNTIASTTENTTLRASYEALIDEFDSLTANFNKLSAERVQLEAQLKGKTGAIQQLEKMLEEKKANASRLAEAADADATASRAQFTQFEAQIRRLEEEKVALNAQLGDIGTKFTELLKQIEDVKVDIIKKKEEAEAAYAAKQGELEEALLRKEEALEQKRQLEATLKSKNEATTAVADEISALKEQIQRQTSELAAERKAKEEAQAALEALHFDLENSTNVTSISTGTAASAEKERLQNIAAALGSIYDRTKDEELLRELEELTAVSESVGKVDSESTDKAFVDKLKSLLLQLALLDDTDIKSTDGLMASVDSPAQALEPVRERMCLLYYFASMSWSLIEERIGRVTPTGPDSSQVDTFVREIDTRFLPDVKDSELWPTITKLGKLIAALSRDKGRIPQDTHQLLETLLQKNSEQNRMNPFRYKSILSSIRRGTLNILPRDEKFITNASGAWEIQVKQPGAKTFSILETPYLYILEMKLLSRYTNYILENSPNRLECPSLQVGQPIEQS